MCRLRETVPGYEASAFFGLGVPHGTPKEIVDILNREINAALKDPTMLAKLKELGGTPSPDRPLISASSSRMRPRNGKRWFSAAQILSVNASGRLRNIISE